MIKCISVLEVSNHWLCCLWNYNLFICIFSYLCLIVDFWFVFCSISCKYLVSSQLAWKKPHISRTRSYCGLTRALCSPAYEIAYAVLRYWSINVELVLAPLSIETESFLGVSDPEQSCHDHGKAKYEDYNWLIGSSELPIVQAPKHWLWKTVNGKCALQCHIGRLRCWCEVYNWL